MTAWELLLPSYWVSTTYLHYTLIAYDDYNGPGTGLKPGAGNTIESSTWVPETHLLCINRKLESRAELRFDPDTLILDPAGVLTARLNNLPYCLNEKISCHKMMQNEGD